MRASAATLNYRMPAQRMSRRAPFVSGRAIPGKDEITPSTKGAATENLDRELARFDDSDTGSERMVGGLVMLVVVLYAAGMAWLLLPVEAIVEAIRQL